MCQQAQALHYNASGLARTRDHEMVTIQKRPAGAPGRGGFAQGYQRIVPKARPGKGGTKKWTGSAICQSSYAPPVEGSRTASHTEGASHGHVHGCGMFTGDMIESGQNEHGLS